MKKILTFLVLIVPLLGCTANKAENKVDTSKKPLIVYFSHTGENYGVGNISYGNTHIIADLIAEKTGGDLFEIEPVKDYPHNSYNECIEVAKKELEAKARPAIKNDKDISGYDVIFIGYPNWWGDMPMCVYTFLEGKDWKGKTVIPFATHEGSGLGSTESKLQSATKGAESRKGLAVQGKVAQNNRDKAKKSVDEWLTGLGY